MLRSLVDNMLAALAPWRCLLCGSRAVGLDLCPECLDGLPWLALPESAPHRRRSAVSVQAALTYAPPVDELITGLKFHGRLANSRVLGELLAIRVSEAWRCGMARPDVIVPVPLHARRFLARGYNQSALIALTAGRELGLPVRPQWLRRVRHTVPQMQLGRSARLRGPAGAFAVPAAQRAACRRRHVALVDDVLTTGATLAACGGALYSAGVARVQYWAVARARPVATG